MHRHGGGHLVDRLRRLPDLRDRSPVAGLVEEIEHPMGVVRAEHDIDPVSALADAVAVLLRHASADGDLHARVRILGALQAAEITTESLIGVLSDRASVDDDDVCGRRIVDGGHSVGREQPADALGIVLVHLAPEGADEVRLTDALRLTHGLARRHAKQDRLSHEGSSARSAGVVLGPVLADDRDLDLTRIL